MVKELENGQLYFDFDGVEIDFEKEGYLVTLELLYLDNLYKKSDLISRSYAGKNFKRQCKFSDIRHDIHCRRMVLLDIKLNLWILSFNDRNYGGEF